MATVVTKQAYRHRTTGDKGWLVFEGVAKFIRYDRPNGPTLPYREADWMEEAPTPPVARAALAKVAFAADRELVYCLGEYSRARRDWMSLTEDERLAWVKNGPTGKHVNPLRVDMFNSIMTSLDPLTKT